MGEALANAIDGLKSGSVPAIHFYKKGVVWGEIVAVVDSGNVMEVCVLEEGKAIALPFVSRELLER